MRTSSWFIVHSSLKQDARLRGRAPGFSDKTRQRHSGLRYSWVHSGILRYTQVYSGILRYTQVHSGILRYTQVHSGTLRYTQGTLRYSQVHSRYTQIYSAILNEGSKRLRKV